MIDAVGYARALYELSEERGAQERVASELQLICKAVREQPGYIHLMDTPAVGSGEKCGHIKEAFGEVEEMLLNFLCLLCEKRSFYRLAACERAFQEAYDEAHNILRAEAITAAPLREEQREALEKKLAAMTGRRGELENTVDLSLIGGIRLRYGGVQLDDSIQTRLETLRRSMAQTIV